MRKLAAIVLAAAALGAAQPAWAESWQVTGNAGDAPQRAVYLVDTDSIVRDGDVVRFRTSTVWESMEGDRDFDKSVTQRQGFCSSKSSKIMLNYVYAHGSLLDVHDTPGEMVTHSPNSVIRTALDAVCGERGYESEPLGDYEGAVRAWFAETR